MAILTDKLLRLISGRRCAPPLVQPWAAAQFFACAAVIFSCAASLRAGAPEPAAVKAVFLYHFSQFVDWPPKPSSGDNSPFVIGILGSDPFGSHLRDAVRNEKAGGRPIVVRHFSKVRDVDSAINILFISDTMSDDLDEVFRFLERSPVLTVSDLDEFARKGGMIELAQEKGKIRLRVNLERTRQVGLTVSSKLLRVAEVLTSDGSP